MGGDASARLCVELNSSRQASYSLLDRLAHDPRVTLTVRRGRVTARKAWFEIELTGRLDDLPEVLRDARRA